MARFEKVADVQATFCIMARSEFYNPFAPESAAMIREIYSLGHKLAPHVIYHDGMNLSATVEADRTLFRREYPGMFDPTFVCFHMPPKSVLWHDFDGFDHAHASRWENHYLSDSRGRWSREKASKVANNMQVCLHPEYWFR